MPWEICIYRAGSGIRKVAPNGIISTIAGGDQPGYAGDGGPAASAQFYDPEGLATDASGSLYIADYANSCIRRIASGTISTIAGVCGQHGFDGDGLPATSSRLNGPTDVAVDSLGNLYIVD
jgi:DNA-binding beta-propeller fold protein YncE